MKHFGILAKNFYDKLIDVSGRRFGFLSLCSTVTVVMMRQ